MTQINAAAHLAARRAAASAASIALADAGPDNSALRVYTAQGGALLGTRHLAKPCGSVRLADGRIDLATGEAPDVVAAAGGAGWVEWVDGNGVMLSAWHLTDTAGNITDGAGAVVPHPDGIGPFRLAGTTGTTLYVGGLINLVSVVIG